MSRAACGAAAACAASPIARGERSRRALRASLLGVLLAAAAAAQDTPPAASHGSPTIPDVPAGPAAIRGRIVHANHPAAAANVEVVLYALPASGVPGLRRTRSDAAGSFAFEGIANDAATAYLVGARYGQVPFPGERVVFEAGQLERRVDVRISEASADPRAVSVSESRLRLDFVGSTLLATETHQLSNAGLDVVYVPEAARGRGVPAFRTVLPDGAGELTLPLGIVPEGLVRRGSAVAFFGPIYPGNQVISFSYTLALSQGAATLRKPLATATKRALVLVPEAAVRVRSPQLRETEAETLEGRRYRALEAKDVRAGTTLALSLELPPVRRAPDALSVSETRLFLELDAAALTVREEHRLRVAGDTAVVGTPDAPLLRIALPEGAEDLRFATDPPGLTLAPAADGGLVVPGPIPAGESSLEILYHVPAGPGATSFERRFTKGMPLLSVFVADTGLTVDSERLHRRRPVRTEDRAYLHLEGFEIGADEAVSLRLAALPARPGLPRAGEIALVALVAAAVVAFLVAPLQRSAAGEVGEPEAPVSRSERDALYAAIRDLDDDFETGKLTGNDHRTMRDELRVRAVALLQAERAAATPTRATTPGPVPPAAEPAPICDACGFAARPDDRFCARCGGKLNAAPLARPERQA